MYSQAKPELLSVCSAGCDKFSKNKLCVRKVSLLFLLSTCLLERELV